MKSNRVEKPYGVAYLTVDYRYHRTNGPAVEWKDGDWGWMLHDRNHRYYGPQNNNGDWFLNMRFIK